MPDIHDPLPREPSNRVPRGPSNRGSTAAFLRSVMPALDLAFGLDDPADFCGEVEEVLARLHAGPLGAGRDFCLGDATEPAQGSVRRPETRPARASLAA